MFRCQSNTRLGIATAIHGANLFLFASRSQSPTNQFLITTQFVETTRLRRAVANFYLACGLLRVSFSGYITTRYPALSKPSPILRFASFEVNVEVGEVRRYGHRIKLQDKPFQILVALLERPGALVTREELQQRLWSDDTFVDFDHNLNNAVDKLRKALNDYAERPKFIETLPRRGYRFIGGVQQLGEPHGQLTTASNGQFTQPMQNESAGRVEDLGTKKVPTPLQIEVPTRPRSALWGVYHDGMHGVLGLAFVALILMVFVGAMLLRRAHGSGKVVQSPYARLLVLPVQDLSGATDQEYLSDGLTEELIARLGRIAPQSLGVIASTTTMKLKKSPKFPAEIGSELNVEYVLSSNLRRLDKLVRISVQLTRVGDRAQIWTADYEREDQNLLGIANKIAVSIEPLLQLPPRPATTAVTREGTNDNEAYEDYLRGRYFWNKRLREDVSIARDYFTKAVARDPNYAKAYSGLADSSIVLAGNYMPPNVAFGKAQEFAEKAIFLDDTLADPHNSLAYVMYAENWDWAGAEREYKRALELDPHYALARHWYFIYLTSMKRFPEAIAQAEKALELDPLSQSINNNAGMTFALAKNYDRAGTQLYKAIELDPRNPVGYGYLGQLYEMEGEYDKAALQFQKAESLQPEIRTYDYELANAYARAGRTLEARKLAQELERFSSTHYANPYWLVVMYSGFKDADKMLPWLDQAVRTHSCTALEINTDPRLDFVRSDPRFQKLATDMHLPAK